ncbi:MAG TPA: hypothetical protein VIS53_08825 [Candidatus Udaeobacter sp.]|jgi:hypothetical protein
MKEIVVIFVEARDVNLSAGHPSGAAKDRADKYIIDNDSVQPFWTWFIENPRPGSFRSVSSLAGLTLAP